MTEVKQTVNVLLQGEIDFDFNASGNYIKHENLQGASLDESEFRIPARFAATKHNETIVNMDNYSPERAIIHSATGTGLNPHLILQEIKVGNQELINQVTTMRQNLKMSQQQQICSVQQVQSKSESGSIKQRVVAKSNGVTIEVQAGNIKVGNVEVEAGNVKVGNVEIDVGNVTQKQSIGDLYKAMNSLKESIQELSNEFKDIKAQQNCNENKEIISEVKRLHEQQDKINKELEDLKFFIKNTLDNKQTDKDIREEQTKNKKKRCCLFNC